MKDIKLTMIINEYRKQLLTNKSPLLHHPQFPNYLDNLTKYLSMPAYEDRISLWPCLDDNVQETPFDKYYFYQDTWTARKIFETHPGCVVDIGSTALLVGIISQFVPTISIDVRPLPVSLPNLTSIRGSITELPLKDHAVELLSSMSVIEHIGLGRYGDRLDTQGSTKAFKEVARVIKPGGHFLFSVPLSHTPGLSFNAHRIFSIQQVLSLLPDFFVREELFLFPEPENKANIIKLQNFQYCVWCAHMIKVPGHNQKG